MGEGGSRDEEVTLVRGRWVVVSADRPPLDDAAVVIRAGRVAEVTTWADARARYADAAVIGSPDHAVLPGFVNAHHHAHAVTLTQHGLPEQPLEPYLLGLAAIRGSDRTLDAMLSGARLLATGVTTAVDLFTGGGTPDDFSRDVRALRHGYAAAGLRVALAAGMATHGNLVHGAGEDARFIATLPQNLARLAASLLPGPGQLREDDYFAAMADLAGDATDPAKSALWYAFPGPEWVTDGFVERIAGHAAVADANLQTHALESLGSREHARRLYAGSPVEHLARLGVLGPRFSMAHAVWLTEPEIGLLAETGAAVVHNPGSNLRLFAGIAPLNALRAAGVTLALGMDGTTLHDDEDVFAEMRLALRLHRDPLAPVAAAPRPADILAAATLGGAKLMRREGQIGALLPGHAADLVVLDLRRVLWPWTAPECDPLDLILLRATAADVDTIMVAGEVAWRDGRPTGFDFDAAVADAARAAAAAYPAERAEAAARLAPHVAAWYGAPPARLAPYAAYNSRR